jgi:hypothetical protein
MAVFGCQNPRPHTKAILLQQISYLYLIVLLLNYQAAAKGVLWLMS